MCECDVVCADTDVSASVMRFADTAMDDDVTNTDESTTVLVVLIGVDAVAQRCACWVVLLLSLYVCERE